MFDKKARIEKVLPLFAEEKHKSVPLFENCLQYPIEKLVELDRLTNEILWECPLEEIPEKIEKYAAFRDSIQRIPGSPEPLPLWPEGKMPAETEYTDNSDFRYNHDPDFKPFFYEMLIPEEAQPKGAIVVCPGGDHGEPTLSEGYQVCKEMNELGYQCFLLLNRPNHNPYNGKECGADTARLIRYVRKNAERYRIPADRVAFAGFSNGGLTGEFCVQYYSGKQTVKDHFPTYVPDELDDYYGAPDALLCVYGPRFNGMPFDYDVAVYPPTFFAVGREDTAMENLNYVYPQLVERGIEVEVHTFAGVPHGVAGQAVHGEVTYPTFQFWEPLADVFMQNVYQNHRGVGQR